MTRAEAFAEFWECDRILGMVDKSNAGYIFAMGWLAAEREATFRRFEELNSGAVGSRLRRDSATATDSPSLSASTSTGDACSGACQGAAHLADETSLFPSIEQTQRMVADEERAEIARRNASVDHDYTAFAESNRSRRFGAMTEKIQDTSENGVRWAYMACMAWLAMNPGKYLYDYPMEELVAEWKSILDGTNTNWVRKDDLDPVILDALRVTLMDLKHKLEES